MSAKARRDKSRPLDKREAPRAIARVIADGLNAAHIQALGCTVTVTGNGVSVRVSATRNERRYANGSVPTAVPMTWEAER